MKRLFVLLLFIYSFASLSQMAWAIQPQAGTTNPPLIYFADYDEAARQSFLIVMEATNFSEVERIPLKGLVPGEVALHPTQPFAYVSTDPANGAGITVVDLAAKIARTVSLPNIKFSTIYYPETSTFDETLYGITVSGELITMEQRGFDLMVKHTLTPQIGSRRDPLYGLAFAARNNGGGAYGLTDNRVIKLDFRPGEIGIVQETNVPSSKSSQGLVLDIFFYAINRESSDKGFIDLFQFSNFLLYNRFYTPKPVYALHLDSNSLNNILYAAGGEKIYCLDKLTGDFRGEIDIPAGIINGSIPRSLTKKSFFLTPNKRVLSYLNLNRELSLIETATNTIITTFGLSKFATNLEFAGNFTSAPPQLELLNFQQEGEIIERGKPHQINFQATKAKFDIVKFKIELTTDGGKKYQTIAENVPGIEKSFTWNVPDQDIDAAQLKISVIDLGGYRKEVTSAIFSIARIEPPADTEPPTIRFLSPLGNETFIAGDTLNITWSATDNTGIAGQDLSLSTDGGTTFSTVIASGLPGTTQNFNYQLPEVDTNSAQLSLKVKDLAGNSSQVTTANFRIQKPVSNEDKEPPLAKFFNPVGNEVFVAGSAINIVWSSSDNVGVVFQELALSIDGGASYPIAIASSLSGSTQNFSYQLPDIDSSATRLCLIVRDGAGNTTEIATPSNFQIKRQSGTGDIEAPTIRFISPKGSERFKAGGRIELTWSSTDNVGVSSQDLALSVDGGNTFPITILSGLSAVTQSFSYLIPVSLQTENARLRLIVKDQAGNTAQAVTEKDFIIEAAAGSRDTIPPSITISKPSGDKLMAGQVIRVNWTSTDNIAVTSQTVSISFDNGQAFHTLANLSGSINEYIISDSTLIDKSASRAMIRISAIDDAGNRGQAENSFSIAPVISQAVYAKKAIQLLGLGFQSTNPQAAIKVFINDNEIEAKRIKVGDNNSIFIKGNKKKLILVKGSNTISVVADGVSSNKAIFTF